MHRFELSPNCSLTAASALMFYLGIVAVSLTVAVGFTLAGYWPVLPFTGLELLALGIALRWSLREGQRREVIRVDDRRVLVRKTGRKGQHEFEFTRPWTRVELVAGAAAAWPHRLVLRSMGRAVEVGGFLTDSERASLAKRLAEIIPGRPGLETMATGDEQSAGAPEF